MTVRDEFEGIFFFNQVEEPSGSQGEASILKLVSGDILTESPAGTEAALGGSSS